MSWADFSLYLVFVLGTACSLFAYFWGRRVKSSPVGAPLDLCNDMDFMAVCGGNVSAGGETEVEAPSAKALIDCLELQLKNPFHGMQSPWITRNQKHGQIYPQRNGENELRFSTRNLAVGDGLVRVEQGADSGRLRVRWALQVPASGTLATVGQIWALLLGLTASIAVPIIIFLFVQGSPNPAVAQQKWQVFQAFQVIWEPFLFIGLAAQQAKWRGRYLETLIVAAAYEASTGRQAAPMATGPMPGSRQ